MDPRTIEEASTGAPDTSDRTSDRGLRRDSGHRRVRNSSHLTAAAAEQPVVSERMECLQDMIAPFQTEDLQDLVLQLLLRCPSIIINIWEQEQPPKTVGPDKPEWCVCGRCREMPTQAERVCCSSKNNCLSLNSKVDGVMIGPLIRGVAHPMRGDISHDTRANEANRRSAYRKFALLHFGHLGKGKRRTIPSCVVWRIRDIFPDPRGNYVGFIPGPNNEGDSSQSGNSSSHRNSSLGEDEMPTGNNSSSDNTSTESDLVDSSSDMYSAGLFQWIVDVGSVTVKCQIWKNNILYRESDALIFDRSVPNSDESLKVQSQRYINQTFQRMALNGENNPYNLPLSPTFCLTNKEGVPFHRKRFQSNFEVIEQIAKAGSTKVMKVRHKVDQQFYAVKRVTLPQKTITVEKLIQEVTIFAKLTINPSPRIVRYHDAWLEEAYTPGAGPNKNHIGAPGSLSPLLPSSLEESTEDDNSGASIMFKDSKEAPVIERETSQPASQSGDTQESAISPESRSSIQTINSGNFFEQEEGAVASRKRHANKLEKIVLYIQMELCSKTLSDWLQQRNESHNTPDQFSCVNSETNLHILRKILEGINFVHQQGILHRDLKPQNVFLTEPHLEVKIGDFGLAREIKCQEDDEEERPSGQGQLSAGIGTSFYIAPEQEYGGDYDNKADMYSFGIIKFEMFHPFGTMMERSKCITTLRKEGAIPEELGKRWPEEAKIIRDLTSLERECRPSASELLESSTYCENTQQKSQQTQLDQRDLLSKYEALMTMKEEADKKLKIMTEEADKLKIMKEEADEKLKIMKKKKENAETELEAVQRKLEESQGKN